jgi:two-component system response regulator AtoC
MRILVIEDDLAARQLLAATLDRLGHEYELASTAVDGIALAESTRFDIVLTDIIMPGLNGLEAVKAIANIAPPIPVIAMSAGSAANAAEDYGVLAMRMGAKAFLHKPFRLAQLLEAIEIALGAAPSIRPLTPTQSNH